MCITGCTFSAVPKGLADFFAQHTKVAVAFSGGADSSYLLYAASVCGSAVKGYYVNSAFQPQFELDDAHRLAAQLGVSIEIIVLDVLADTTIAANPADRCYYCKKSIFGRITAAAAADGFDLLIDGTNASDDAGDRPGMRALTELSVRSPLRECGITKAELREYSRVAGLFTWDKPAYACLATRIPTGMAIDADTLARVEQGENKLAALGFTDFRLRVIAGDTAKLQLPQQQLDIIMGRRQEIFKALSEHFSDVVLDLKPRSKGD